MYDWIIKNCRVIDGGISSSPTWGNIGIEGDKIRLLSGDTDQYRAKNFLNAEGNILGPGLIDVHTHDDLAVVLDPDMTPKISQGVTTVIVGNCGISSSPAKLKNCSLPDPMNLLGKPRDFQYESLDLYKSRLLKYKPSINVASLIGHTTLRNNHLDDLSVTASRSELILMREDLEKSMNSGALGLSSGLAYSNARNASSKEIEFMLEEVSRHNGVYTTHLRNEFDDIIEALEEAINSSTNTQTPLIISHHKVAGPKNWGRSDETLKLLNSSSEKIEVSCDCYPYSASSSTLDLSQVTEEIKIAITWSEPHPECAGMTLHEIATKWGQNQIEAARKLQPAGAIYHNMDFSDVKQILCWKNCMIGSDGLPCDPNPHPRLYGTFSKILGPFVRDLKLFNLPIAIHKMTGLPASKFPLGKRGRVIDGYVADLLLFNPDTISDLATFESPRQLSQGILGVWVNGKLCYQEKNGMVSRNGKFIDRNSR